MAMEKTWDRVLTVAITVGVTGVLGLVGSTLAGGALIEALGGATKGQLQAAVAAIGEPDRSDEISPGAVMAYDLPNGCPSGWQALPNAAGRYIVGLSPKGVLGKAVGTALSDGESRAVGKHTHKSRSGGSHVHTLAETQGIGGTHGAAAAAKVGSHSTSSAGAHSHGIESTGLVEGTNAPYIQLLICKKA